MKTTKQPIADLVGSAAVLVTEVAMEKYRKIVEAAAFSAQRIENREELDVMLASALFSKSQYDGYADAHKNSHYCGKHLLDLTLLYMDSAVGTALNQVDRFEIAMRLLLHLSITAFERVRKAILDAVTMQKAGPSILALMS